MKKGIPSVSSFSNLIPDVTHESIQSRMRWNAEHKIMLLNFEGLEICTKQEVDILQETLEYHIKLHTQEHHSVVLYANYNNFVIEDAVMDRYGEMVAYLSVWYKAAYRYTQQSDNLAKFKQVLKQVAGADFTNVKLFLGKYIRVKELGEGSFGHVFLCQHAETADEVAVKIMNKQTLKQMQVMHYIQREIQILETLDHPNIAKMIEYHETPDEIYIVQEFITFNRLGLSDWDDTETVDENKAKNYATQIIAALEYLHKEKQIMHRDLQLDNICMDENGVVKIIDFGCADFFTTELKHAECCGKYQYCAPEMLTEQPYGAQVDLWSLGVLLFRLVTGMMPFRTSEKTLLGQFSIDLKDEPISNGTAMNTRKYNIILELRDLLRRMLARNVTDRLSLEQIKSHAWFQPKP